MKHTIASLVLVLFLFPSPAMGDGVKFDDLRERLGKASERMDNMFGQKRVTCFGSLFGFFLGSSFSLIRWYFASLAYC